MCLKDIRLRAQKLLAILSLIVHVSRGGLHELNTTPALLTLKIHGKDIHMSA